MQLYIVNYESAYQYHKFMFLFGVLFICRNGLWCAYDMQCLGLGVWVFFGWWRLRGWLKGIKRTSSSAPSMEKHDILHSRIINSIVVFRHCFLLVLIVRLRRFLWSYFMTNVQSALYSLCESALKARAQISLLAGEFIPSHRKRTCFLSVRHYMSALKNYLLSWV